MKKEEEEEEEEEEEKAREREQLIGGVSGLKRKRRMGKK